METAKEKAQELVDKMMLYSYEKIENQKNINYIVDNKIKKEYAIQCAIITVDYLIHSHSQDTTDNQFYWWQEVKQELEKL